MGSHGVDHLDLTRAAPDVCTQQLVQSRDEIDRRLGAGCKHFAYTWGRSNARLRALVSQCGYRYAAGGVHGPIRPGFEPMNFPRINVSRDYSLDDFKADRAGRLGLSRLAAAREGVAYVRVLINAISIKEGGSLVVLTRLLHAMVARRPDIEWHAAVHPGVARESLLPPAVVPWAFPWIERSPLHLVLWYEIALPRLVRRLRADVLFSQTNYLPRRAVGCPSLLLEQHAGHFSEDFRQRMERDLGRRPSIWAWRRKDAWVRHSVRMATRVTVQTAALANEIHLQANVPNDRIDVVPHGPGLVAQADQAEDAAASASPGEWAMSPSSACRRTSKRRCARIASCLPWAMT